MKRLDTRMVRIGYGGNRGIGLEATRMLIEHDMKPVLLLDPGPPHRGSLEAILELTGPVPTIGHEVLSTPAGLAQLRDLDLDYLLSVHYPRLIPAAALSLVRYGGLNLHPSLLPFNQGWHTPTWAILDGIPHGATLHWMEETFDTGDIALQTEVLVEPSDTAHSLYQRTLRTELELLREALPLLGGNSLQRRPQGPGSRHYKKDILKVQQLDCDSVQSVGETLGHLRALTTNRLGEAAYFVVNGRKIAVQVVLQELDDGENG